MLWTVTVLDVIILRKRRAWNDKKTMSDLQEKLLVAAVARLDLKFLSFGCFPTKF